MRWVVALACVALCQGAFAIDIVTMPAANQLRGGEVELGTYYVKLQTPPSFPQHAYLEELAVGVTGKLEIDALYIDADGDKDSTLVSFYYKVLKETRELPDISVGGWNITAIYDGFNWITGIVGSEQWWAGASYRLLGW